MLLGFRETIVSRETKATNCCIGVGSWNTPVAAAGGSNVLPRNISGMITLPSTERGIVITPFGAASPEGWNLESSRARHAVWVACSSGLPVRPTLIGLRAKTYPGRMIVPGEVG